MRDGTGSQTQKGIVHYGLSANRQRPLAGTAHAAIFNTWRRFSAQVLYFAPPLVLGYYAMQWAIERLVFYIPYLTVSALGLWLTVILETST
jgi:UcrQ family